MWKKLQNVFKINFLETTMTDIAVRVENLGWAASRYAPRDKRYQLGGQKSGSFRESLTRAFRRPEAGVRKR